MNYFESHKATELFGDASKFNIGAVLQQIDDYGESHPVGYYSLQVPTQLIEPTADIRRMLSVDHHRRWEFSQKQGEGRLHVLVWEW